MTSDSWGSGRRRGDDDISRWANMPEFDWLEPAPWSSIKVHIQVTVGVFVLGFTLAYLGYNHGFRSLTRPAKWTWTSGLLLTLYTLAIGLPRVAKFVIIFFIGGVMVLPVFLMLASGWVYTGKWTHGKDEAIVDGDMDTKSKTKTSEGKGRDKLGKRRSDQEEDDSNDEKAEG